MIIFSRLKSFLSKISSGVLKNKKRIFIITTGLVLIGIIFVIPRAIFAQDGVGDAIGDKLTEFFGFLIGLLVWLFGDILLFMVKAVVRFSTYNDFANSTAVVVGWVIVRDLVNMFFVVVLLIIAIATILKIESYSYKKMLGRLVLMAVLVNFSKTISLIIIDFAQVIMMTFVNGFQAAAGGNFVQALGLDQILQISTETNEITGPDVVIAYLLGLLMVLISCVVVGMMLIILVMRMVVLWILIVLSPLAFFLSIIPQAQKYANQWWSQFTEYVLVGPILAFFLWLSLISVTTLSSADQPGILNGDTKETMQRVAISQIGSEDRLISFVIAIGMLIAGLTMTGKMGVIGAGIGVGVLASAKKTGLGAARFVSKWGGKKAYRYAGRKFNELAPTWMNIPAIARGWGQRSKELEERAKTVAVARARGRVEQAFTGVKLPYEDMIERKQEAEHSKEWSHMQKEQKADILRKLWGKNDIESVRKRRSLMTAMATEGHIDDALATDYFKELYRDKETGEYRKIDKKLVDRFLMDACMTGENDQQGIRTMEDIGEIGKKIKHFEYYGKSGYNVNDGKWEINSDEKAAGHARDEISKLSTREQKSLHPHNYGALVHNANTGKYEWGSGDEGGFEDINWRNKLAKGATGDKDDELKRYAPERIGYLLGRFEQEEAKFIIDDGNLDNLLKRWETGEQAVKILEKKVGSQGVKYEGSDPYIGQTEFKNFEELIRAIRLARGEIAPPESGEENFIGPVQPPPPPPPSPEPPAQPGDRDFVGPLRPGDAGYDSSRVSAAPGDRDFVGPLRVGDVGYQGPSQVEIDNTQLASTINDAIRQGVGQEIRNLTQSLQNIRAPQPDLSAMQVALDKIAEGIDRTNRIMTEAQTRKKKRK